ncbi:hypothetical protein E2562_003983 [Oryza meyeriana var. granulata]|uniref:Uncharacterized protein n=1 Tax=Oryza meyeriana var. granulata TaxID=110450 RepID=A0A6G1BIK0_9ORYZ|nr:hypothetical protein E2562_003983 [Oryza meyeriana var. granulata]
MNPLRKTGYRQGSGVPGTYASSTRAAATRAPVTEAVVTRAQAGAVGVAAGVAAARAQAGAAGVAQHAGVPRTCSPRVGGSPVGGWWPTTSPSDRFYPPGGFTNFLQSNPFSNHPNGNENFHFVGAAMSQSSMSPAQQTDDIVDDVDAQDDEAINIDEDCRTDKRLNWSASAWLHNSKDLVDGIGRKADAYWTDLKCSPLLMFYKVEELSVVLGDMWIDLVNKPANS